MRSVELAKVAVAAEGLRLRRLARRQAMRAAYGAGAAVFGLAGFAVLHFTLYVLLRFWLAPIWAVLIVLVLDLVAAGVLGAMALSSTPDSVEVEARDIRAQSLIELRRSMTAMGMASEIGGAIFRSRARAGVRRGTAAAVAEALSRVLGR